MNTIKTLSLIGLIALGLAAPAVAAVNPSSVIVPLNQRNEEAFPENVGYLHMRNSATSEMIVCTGRCLLKAILMSTGPISSYVTLRNTSVAQGNGAKVIDLLAFNPLNTGPAGGRIELGILLEKGISATLSSVSNNQEITVLYRDLD